VDFFDNDLFVVFSDSFDFLSDSWSDYFVLLSDDSDFLVANNSVVFFNFSGLDFNDSFDFCLFVLSFSLLDNFDEIFSWNNFSSDFLFDDSNVCNFFDVSDSSVANSLNMNSYNSDLFGDDSLVMFSYLSNLFSDDRSDDWVCFFDDSDLSFADESVFSSDDLDFLDENFFGLFFNNSDLSVTSSVDSSFDGFDDNTSSSDNFWSSYKIVFFDDNSSEYVFFCNSFNSLDSFVTNSFDVNSYNSDFFGDDFLVMSSSFSDLFSDDRSDDWVCFFDDSDLSLTSHSIFSFDVIDFLDENNFGLSSDSDDFWSADSYNFSSDDGSFNDVSSWSSDVCSDVWSSDVNFDESFFGCFFDSSDCNFADSSSLNFNNLDFLTSFLLY